MVAWWWVRAVVMLCGWLFVLIAQRNRTLLPVDRMAMTVAGWALFLYVLYTSLRGK